MRRLGCLRPRSHGEESHQTRVDMHTDFSEQASIGGLSELLREASVLQASQYFDGHAVELVACPENLKLGQVLMRYLSIVLLTSSKMRIVLKVHFNPDHVRRYRVAQGGSSDDVTDTQLVDYMKEFCNQVGGRVCRIFETNQIPMGMSVPLCYRGIYEIYADYTRKSGTVTKFGDFWRLDGPFNSIYCSCYVELMSKHDFSGIQSTDGQSQEGELDFL